MRFREIPPLTTIEPLEPRTLLHGFAANVNFQAAGAAVPAGYVPDTGAAFADRGNGFTYGWVSTNTSARDRNSGYAPDQRYDTLIHMQLAPSSSPTWEIAAPDGAYTVRLVGGDPQYVDCVLRVSVEGTLVLSGTPTQTNRFVDGRATVTVTDGRLTVTNAAGAVNNKICFIEISDHHEPLPGALPAGWASADVGPVAAPGSASGDGATFTVTGGGANFYGQIDELHYAYRTLAGDGTIVARVDAQQATSPYTKAGVMIRESLAAGAKHATVAVTPGENGIYFQTRASTGGASASTRHPGFRAPYWVRLVRTGSTLTGHRSPDGATWTPVGSATIPMTGGVLVGLVVSAYSASATSAARFSNVSVTQPQPPPPPPVPGTFAWQAVAPSPVARSEAQGAVVNGRLYVLGGFHDGAYNATTRADAYDPATSAWTRTADLPEAITHAGQTTHGRAIYLAGGYVGKSPGPSTAHVWRYDTVADAWTPGPALPAPRGGGGLVRVGRTLHFVSGATRAAGASTSTDHPDHWTLDLGPTDSAADDAVAWRSAAPVPNPRNHLGAVELNGKVYVIGGQHGENEVGGNQTSVDVYDPATATWTSAAALPRPTGHITASVFAMNGRIVVAGGVTTNKADLADVLSYDPAANVWVRLRSLPTALKSTVAGHVNGRMIVSTGSGATFGDAATWTAALAGTWEPAASLPVAVGEVAGGVIGNRLYLVGEGSGATLAYNLSTNTWTSTTALAQRPFKGHHHAAEVIGGRLYLFGGLGGGSDGRVQIYNPATNAWTAGAAMPWAGGSVSTAVIGGKVYVAGGIVGTTTVNNAAAYDPATNTWAPIAPMPHARNHAAAATDGTRVFIFGGRTGANVVSNGFDTVQIYDPATNAWTTSLDAGSTLAPLPIGRGGMGKAVFHGGAFHVLGGETLTGPGATASGVYDRVDIYDPLTNTWRPGPKMLVAKHGIFPVLVAGRVYVAGGGIKAANSQSTSLHVLNV